jgi:MoaA/NifB/PqqE/SkfB family radical SAM enzyme
MLVRDAAPAWLMRRRTAFPALSRIARDLRANGAAAGTLRQAKVELYGELKKSFEVTAAQALTLKTLNLLLTQRHLHKRSPSLASRPIGLVVDPANTCRLACPGCVHSSHNEARGIFDWPNGTLTEERFAKLLRQYGPYGVGVYFCDYGEPLLNVRTPGLIRKAKQYLLSAKLSTSLSVKKLDAEALVASGLDFLVISIDGATQPVYEKFRRNGSLDLALSNIRFLVEAKKKLKSAVPALSWNFLAFEHNVHEIPLAAKLAKQLGVNQFRVVDPFDVSWDDPDIRPAPKQGEVRRFDWVSASNRPDNWNPFPESLEAEMIGAAFDEAWESYAGLDADEPGGGHTCRWLYENMIMDATGRILPCCGGPPQGGSLVFANVEEDEDPFNSEKYQEARRFFTGKSPGDNVHCSTCEWDQEQVNIGGEEIRRYFRAVDSGIFDRPARELLSDSL